MDSDAKSKKPSPMKKTREATTKRSPVKSKVVEKITLDDTTEKSSQNYCMHCGFNDPCAVAIKEYIDQELAQRESAVTSI